MTTNLIILILLVLSLILIIALVGYEIYYWSNHISAFRLIQYKDIFLLESKKLTNWVRVGSFDEYDEAYDALKSNISAEIAKCEHEITGGAEFTVNILAMPIIVSLPADRVLVYSKRIK